MWPARTYPLVGFELCFKDGLKFLDFLLFLASHDEGLNLLLCGSLNWLGFCHLISKVQGSLAMHDVRVNMI